jgi:hypothetical protein
MGPQYPGAGGRIRLSIAPGGQTTELSPLNGARVDLQVGKVVGRVAGMLVAGGEYPLSSGRTIDCWVREERPGFLKIDLDETTIICGATLAGEYYKRIIQSILNTHRLRELTRQSQGFSFVPIVKAGVFLQVAYYVEAFHLPEVVMPDLTRDSVRFCRFLVVGKDSPFAIANRSDYLTKLARGYDPQHVVAFEPYFCGLLSEVPEDRRRQLIADIGQQVNDMTDALEGSPHTSEEKPWSLRRAIGRLFRH